MKVFSTLPVLLGLVCAVALLDVSSARELTEAEMVRLDGGAFTRCQDPGGITNPAEEISACNECVGKKDCTSTDIATKCKAYTNPYACVECESGILTCTGNHQSYPLDGCAGPPTTLAACPRNIHKAKHQACTGQCP